MPKGIYKRGVINRKPHSQETIEKIRLGNLGKKMSPESVERIRLSKKGVKYPNRKHYAKGITPIHKVCEFCKKDFITNCFMPKKRFCSKSCRVTVTLKNPLFTTLGKKGSEKQREIMKNKKGELHPRWIKDRTVVMEKHRMRGTTEWKDWRMAVFSRDKYTCQECEQSGVIIEPHHIIPLRISFDKAFDTNNGITLCRPCHQKTIFKEETFYEKYSQKILKIL
jgi:5-methylcytosine-specific restriction endonuclease McrA